MIYLYRIRLGLATLTKMEDSGTDIDQKPKRLVNIKQNWKLAMLAQTIMRKPVKWLQRQEEINLKFFLFDG